MYKFKKELSEEDRIGFLQRTILIHSYLYYIKDNPLWTDKQFDDIAKQLFNLQTDYINKNGLNKFKKTEYGYVFHDFNSSTGFYLYNKLKNKDKKVIECIAENLLAMHK